MGHQAKEWDDKDRFPLMIMNEILGGGGFTSRITKRIRSDEGLAYSAGSAFGIGQYWPGLFRVSFQTKNATVAYAAKIALEEIRRIQTEPVSEDELRIAKAAYIDTFPSYFDSKQTIANLYAADLYHGRPHSYWKKYRERVQKVSAADVQRVAKKYLTPDAMVFLVVGKWDEIAKGSPDHEASIEEFFGGTVKHIPLRDPLTLEPQQ